MKHTFAAHSILVSFFCYYTTIIRSLLIETERKRMKKTFRFLLWIFFLNELNLYAWQTWVFFCHFNADISFINETKQFVCRIHWTDFWNRRKKAREREIENRWTSENWKENRIPIQLVFVTMSLIYFYQMVDILDYVLVQELLFFPMNFNVRIKRTILLTIFKFKFESHFQSNLNYFRK